MKQQLIHKWQLIWYWEWPWFKYWEYPYSWKALGMNTPILKGWYFGIFEIRYFPRFPKRMELGI